MPRFAKWALATVASVLFHAMVAGLYLATRSFEEAPTQTRPSSTVEMATLKSPTERLTGQKPTAKKAKEAQEQGTSLADGDVPRTEAQASQPTGDKAEAINPRGDIVNETTDTGEEVPVSQPQADKVTAISAETAPVVAAAVEMQQAQVLQTPSQAALQATPARFDVSDQANLDIERAEPAQPDALATSAVTLPATSVTALIAPATAIMEATSSSPSSTIPQLDPEPVLLAGLAQLPAQPIAETAGDGLRPLEPPLPVVRSKAALAWQFSDRVVTDPQALETIQAFMAPQSLENSDQVRDELSSVLKDVDCARLSANFIPETGVLELRGHIPDPTLRAPILDAMQKQVGNGLPVSAELLHLPSPQCDALTGISAVGLPQSTDQFTNARLIGQSAHVREYKYSEGQRLQFDLVAPDYDAYIYVDYFTADGDVIHLVPNDTIALERTQAKSTFGVGQDNADKPSLVLTIAPPFGQEIAVAFAASRPLYDELRPITEPAEPYLDWLKQRVAKARALDADFKGEWVYFFITTRASP